MIQVVVGSSGQPGLPRSQPDLAGVTEVDQELDPPGACDRDPGLQRSAGRSPLSGRSPGCARRAPRTQSLPGFQRGRRRTRIKWSAAGVQRGGSGGPHGHVERLPVVAAQRDLAVAVNGVYSSPSANGQDERDRSQSDGRILGTDGDRGVPSNPTPRAPRRVQVDGSLRRSVGRPGAPAVRPSGRLPARSPAARCPGSCSWPSAGSWVAHAPLRRRPSAQGPAGWPRIGGSGSWSSPSSKESDEQGDLATALIPPQPRARPRFTARGTSSPGRIESDPDPYG